VRAPLRLALVALAALTLAAAVAGARAWSWLGVRIRDLSEQEMEEIASRHGIREGFGVVIVEVMADTPAARAGMKNGDIVVAFGEHPVVETPQLQRQIAAAPTDCDTLLTVLRPGGRRALKVRLTTMPLAIAGERVAAEFGFSLQERHTDPRSPAARSGLRGRRRRARERSGEGGPVRSGTSSCRSTTGP
jgi:serine protease Do